MNLAALLKKNWFHLLSLIILGSVILWWAVPGLFAGAHNLNMIRHFSQDEAYIVEWASNIYTRLVIPWDQYGAYPFLFYYLAGIFLVPYTILKGIDPSVIAAGFKILSLSSFLLTVILTYYLGVRVFKSWLVGFLASLLLILTREELLWTLHSRPHLLANLLILGGLYCCIRFAEAHEKKYFRGALFFAAAAFATDFTGVFVLPIVWFLDLEYKYSRERGQLAAFLKSKKTVIFAAALFFILLGTLAPIYANYLTTVYRLPTGKLIADYPAVASQVIKISLLIGGGLVFLGVLWWSSTLMVLKRNLAAGKKKRQNKMNLSELPLLLSGGIGSGVMMFALFILIFLCLNPSIIFYPTSYVAQAGYLVLGSSMGWPGATKIIEPNIFTWIPVITSSTLLGIGGAVLFLLYLLWEGVAFSHNWRADRPATTARLVLLSYTLLFLGLNFFFMNIRKPHYLLSVLPAIYLVMASAVDKVIRADWSKAIKGAAILLVIGLLLFNSYERFPEWVKTRNLLKSKNEDTGVYVGAWLERNFDAKTKIWLDSNVFYVPPKFTDVVSMRWYDKIEASIPNIIRFDPDVLVITSTYDLIRPYPKENERKIDRAIKDGELVGFRKIRQFKYKGLLSVPPYGMHKKVVIYSKE